MREDRGHNGIHKTVPPGDGETFPTLVYDSDCRACRESAVEKPEPTLEELAAARDVAGAVLYSRVWVAALAAGVPMQTVVQYCAAGQAMADLVRVGCPGIDYGDTPLGQRMSRDSELYLGTARGMPNSEARKRQEERDAWPPLTCRDCGHTGVDVGLRYCIDSAACRERETKAKACLEPVPRSLGDVYRFRKRLRKASHALTQV